MVSFIRANQIFLIRLMKEHNKENLTNLTEIDNFVGGSLKIEGSSLVIHTLEGDMEASINDYIIKGVNGEFYPCKPDIFDKTYESAQ